MTVLIQAIIFAVVLLAGVWLLAVPLGEWGLIVAAALAIGGLFAGFMAVSDRLERMEQKLDELTRRPEGRGGEQPPEESIE